MFSQPGGKVTEPEMVASEAIMPQFYREYFSNQCLFGLVFCD